MHGREQKRIMEARQMERDEEEDQYWNWSTILRSWLKEKEDSAGRQTPPP